MFDLLFTIAASMAQQVRRVARIIVRTDPETGEPVEQPVDARRTTLSQDGSIDTVQATYATFYDCGCISQNNPGGRCQDCGPESVICERCYGRCARCARPICLEHSEFVTTPGGEGAVRLCRACNRRRILLGFARGAVSPFVTFKPPEAR